MIKFNSKFALITLYLLATEICFALFLKDGFIRYTFGDFLATILLYCAIKSVFNLKSKYIAFITLSIAFTLEAFQYFNLLEVLNLHHYKLLNIVMGSHFSLEDVLAYTLGTLCIYFIDK
ncbi:DUF2809 domain-containing protein [Aurantibacter sp.]|uniref:ribosomal maturation YjgA family protein n=1 Tax=Aurantibacter sp. TaxID=2807103 RepID=UPI0035C7ED9C